MYTITKETNYRNKQWDLMRAIGIIAVVIGHNYQPPYLFFPVWFFHMGLFFFISGYFFIPQISIKDKIKYFMKKTRNLLLPFYAFNLLFGLITMWLKSQNILLGSNLNLQTMFIAPFGRGDHFPLFLVGWFLFSLYFICIFAGLIYQKSLKVNITILFFAFLLMLGFLSMGHHNNLSQWGIFMGRCLFGFFFLSLGYMFRLYELRIQKFLINPLNLVYLYIIVNFLEVHYGSLGWYGLITANPGNDIVIVPIISAFCIILMIYIITYYVTRLLNPKAFIYEIGRNSFSIMVWHLFIFFLVKFMLYELNLVPFSYLNTMNTDYNVKYIWFINQIPAIIIPVFMARYYYLIKDKAYSFLTNFIYSNGILKKTEQSLLLKTPTE